MQFHNKLPQKKFWAFLIFAGAALFIGHELELYLPDLELWIMGWGVWAPILYILCFVMLTPFFVSVDALCFAAGVLFPVVVGELAMVLATYLSATLIFVLGRSLMHERALAFTAGHSRFAALEKAINANNPFKLMLLLRVTPIPFALLSYALSVTQVNFRPYLAATSGIFLYNGSLVYLGYATKHLTGLAGGGTLSASLSHAQLIVVLIVVVAVLLYVVKTANKILREMNVDQFDG